jgi:capsular polysaccharide biosynthesis protein
VAEPRPYRTGDGRVLARSLASRERVMTVVLRSVGHARSAAIRLRTALARWRATARPRFAETLFRYADVFAGRRGVRRATTRGVLPFANAATRNRTLLPIVWLDTRPPAREFAPGAAGTAVSPRIDGRSVTEGVTLPAVRLYEFTDVQVSAGAAVFRSERDVTIERVPGVAEARCSFIGERLLAHGRHVAALPKRTAAATPLEKGFFLSGFGDWNYYHWMIELLPKLAHWHGLPPELRAYPLLVGPAVREHPSLLEALAVFCDDAEIRVLNDGELYTVGHLAHINAPSTCPFNLRPDEEVRVTDFLIRPDVIHDWRDRVELGRRRPTSPGRRLFLARSAAHRAYNEVDVLPVFTRAGFETVYLERMSLREQIDALHSADVVAGPTGAAWTNLIWCRDGTKALCWLPEQSTRFSAFSTIASIVGVDLRYLAYSTPARSTAELYHASYRLDVDEVERTVAALLAEI